MNNLETTLEQILIELRAIRRALDKPTGAEKPTFADIDVSSHVQERISGARARIAANKKSARVFEDKK